MTGNLTTIAAYHAVLGAEYRTPETKAPSLPQVWCTITFRYTPYVENKPRAECDHAVRYNKDGAVPLVGGWWLEQGRV